MKERAEQFGFRFLIKVGLCGEIAMPMLHMLPGYYDHNRRVVTGLIRNGLLRERRFKTYDRRIVRSLSLTNEGLEQIRDYDPDMAYLISQHPLYPASGQGNWERTRRLHRGAACLLMAERLGAVYMPGEEKDAALGKRLVYYSAYEINKRFDMDNKSARVSGVLISPDNRYYLLYYLGRHNMRWNPEVESAYRDRLEYSLIGCDRRYYRSILIADNWDIGESLVSHAENPRTRLIRCSSSDCMNLVTFDDNGLKLLRLLVDEDREFALMRWLNNTYDVPMPQTPTADYLFSISDVLGYYPTTQRCSRLAVKLEGYFFDFQITVMQKINGGYSKLYSIPVNILDEFERQYSEKTGGEG